MNYSAEGLLVSAIWALAMMVMVLVAVLLLIRGKR